MVSLPKPKDFAASHPNNGHAPLKTRKRRRDNEPLPSSQVNPKRRQLTEREPDPSHWRPPPRFWNGLPNIPLVHAALVELKRRTRKRRHYPLAPAASIDLLPPSDPRELARFAKHGGPDLSDLRGYPIIMDNYSPDKSLARNKSPEKVTKPTDPTTLPKTESKTKTSTYVFNKVFLRHLQKFHIHIPFSSVIEELDPDEFAEILAVRRPEVSRDKFSVENFKELRQGNFHATNEATVLQSTVYALAGPWKYQHPFICEALFNNFAPLTDGSLVVAKPDRYYGSFGTELDTKAQDVLSEYVYPTKDMHLVAPNFFLEVKGPDGNFRVAEHQACYDGALGARAMHVLQNYGNEESEYDGRAYTFSAVFHHTGLLRLFAHHMTAPKCPGGRPEYHMTQLWSNDIMSSREECARGISAYLNLRDLAQQHRSRIISEVNAKVKSGVIWRVVGVDGVVSSDSEDEDEDEDEEVDDEPATPRGPVGPPEGAAEGAAEKAAEGAAEKAAEGAAERAAEGAAERAAEKAADGPLHGSTDGAKSPQRAKRSRPSTDSRARPSKKQASASIEA